MPKKKEDPLKHCKKCGSILERKRYNGVIEDRSRFLKREYCSPECCRAQRRENSSSISFARRQSRKHLKTECETCKTGEGLQIHHRDEDPFNNSPENLQTLCGACHTRWHWQNGKKPSIQKQSVGCKVCGKVEGRYHLGMCQKHYQRFKRHGNVNLVRRSTGRHTTALVEIT